MSLRREESLAECINRMCRKLNDAAMDAVARGDLKDMKDILNDAHISSHNNPLRAEILRGLHFFAACQNRPIFMETLQRLGAQDLSSSFLMVARYGFIESLKTIEGQDTSDTRFMALAAMSANIECLDCLHSKGFSMDESATSAAAHAGRIMCLIFLHKMGCPWDVGAGRAAASAGHVRCLEYLCENGCPCDHTTLQAAASSGNFLCFEYLKKILSPGSESILDTMAFSSDSESLRCLLKTRLELSYDSAQLSSMDVDILFPTTSPTSRR